MTDLVQRLAARAVGQPITAGIVTPRLAPRFADAVPIGDSDDAAATVLPNRGQPEDDLLASEHPIRPGSTHAAPVDWGDQLQAQHQGLSRSQPSRQVSASDPAGRQPATTGDTGQPESAVVDLPVAPADAGTAAMAADPEPARARTSQPAKAVIAAHPSRADLDPGSTMVARPRQPSAEPVGPTTHPDSFAQAGSNTPAIRVHIGRLDIRTAPAPPARPPHRAAPLAPLALGDWLRGKDLP